MRPVGYPSLHLLVFCGSEAADKPPLEWLRHPDLPQMVHPGLWPFYFISVTYNYMLHGSILNRKVQEPEAILVAEGLNKWGHRKSCLWQIPFPWLGQAGVRPLFSGVGRRSPKGALPLSYRHSSCSYPRCPDQEIQ